MTCPLYLRQVEQLVVPQCEQHLRVPLALAGDVVSSAGLQVGVKAGVLLGTD